MIQLFLYSVIVTAAIVLVSHTNMSTTVVHAATAAEWKQRTIYQLLTDRFAPPPSRRMNQQLTCSKLDNYCGGTWSGIEANLDYIAQMGFDAIWISPIVQNSDGGYHGYWMQDLWSLNSRFGTEQELKSLVRACHERNMLVMIDVVLNHVAPIGTRFELISPFNQSVHYHPWCEVVDYMNQTQVEVCRLLSLPDLDQDHPFVQQQLSQWLVDVIQRYKFDGIRLDTVPFIAKPFYRSIMSNVVKPRLNDLYIVGEVFDGRMDYVASYANILGSTLDYPLYFTLKNVFANRDSMFNIRSVIQASIEHYDDTGALGLFIDNHDNTRFLYSVSDRVLYQNALTFVLFARGVPIVYYGAEQGFRGGSGPHDSREILWNNMDRKSYWYQLVQKMVTFRRSVIKEMWQTAHVERYVQHDIYCFSRGPVFIATTNVGSAQPRVSYAVPVPDYPESQVFCNVFWPDDCIRVTNGQLDIQLLNGESKIFYPKGRL